MVLQQSTTKYQKNSNKNSKYKNILNIDKILKQIVKKRTTQKSQILNAYIITLTTHNNKQITISKRIMELEQSQIINLAVNIFQNVGIKRYIGQIQALRHEDIYFQIYKIIFPDSMINIFKISESTLTTGQKIQKIIQEISSIIQLDLYHISGQAIAQGNRNHLTNWLQLLEALSNNCIAYQTYHGGGSAPDRDRQMYQQFDEDDYYTVQAVEGQFEKHVYTDQNTSLSQADDTSQPQIKNNRQYLPKKNKSLQKEQQIEYQQNSLDRSFRKSDSSRNSNVLKPIQQPIKKHKVTFKQDERVNGGKGNPYQKNLKTTMKKLNENDKNTATSIKESTKQPFHRPQVQTIVPQYGYTNSKTLSSEQKLLKKKKSFILKMHKIEEEMERKKINDEVVKFQQWVHQTNQQSAQIAMNIEQENRSRTEYINKKIAQRQKYVNSLAGGEEVYQDIKQVFKKQRNNQKRMRKILQQQQMRQADELMDLNFAAEVESMVMASIGKVK